MHKIKNIEFAGVPVVAETGKIAKQSHGAVMLSAGETVVLATVCLAEAREGLDFFPLTVEYRDKMAAAGKIPGGFFKREGRPATEEILRCRIVDRCVRPLFPDGFTNEVQIIISTMSYDQENIPDVLAVNAASMALCLSQAPFGGPVSAVRIAKIDGELVVNPSDGDLANSEFDLLLVGLDGKLNMIEAGGNEMSEADFLAASKLGIEKIEEFNQFQKDFVADVQREKIEFVSPTLDENILAKTDAGFKPMLSELYNIKDKVERYETISARKNEFIVSLTAELGLDETSSTYNDSIKMIKKCIEEVEYDYIRDSILVDKVRSDGRGLDEIRNLESLVDILPRTHGSAIFSRGETQALATVTLGTKRDEQIIDSLREVEERRRFILHYSFPPFSVGEVRRMMGVSRRETGHGALAEKALAPLLPTAEEFPYTVRVVSDIMESNGSSSMASVCAGTLSMLAAGVPMKNPCAGIAMGIITKGDDWEVLTDIAGIEDHKGDMDFKVAGTRKGITAIQLDVKCTGVNPEQIEKTLEKARIARLHILDNMEATISEARGKLSLFAPRIEAFKVDPDKIREIIGPGGKMIKKITADSGAQIEIDDEGTVHVISSDGNKLELARKMINDIVREVEVGEVYNGTVKRVMNFGAFIEVLPGKEGLCHISELDINRVEKVEDILNLGDECQVKVIEIDAMGRVNLSRKVLLDGYVPRENTREERPPRDSRPPRESRPPRDNNRGPRRDNNRGPRDGNNSGGRDRR